MLRADMLTLYYQQTVEIWDSFCRLHQELFEKTCDEYQLLLKGELEQLQDLIQHKDSLIAQIAETEKLRQNTIHSLNEKLPSSEKIMNVIQLLDLLQKEEERLTMPALSNLNALLIDIIKAIQEQNKKNQIFLNKAMISLKGLKDSFAGKSSPALYGRDGQTTKYLTR